MFDLLANLLSFLYDINNSYVVAIVLLTLVVLIVSTPLTLKGTRSQLQMSLLQPELKAIQDKYGKDEKEAQNKELMEFYQENNINPVGGCLPLLFQIPIFLVLYRVILGLTRRATDIGFQIGATAGNVTSDTDLASFESQELNQFNPAFVSRDSQLFSDLSSSNRMEALGFDIARSASEVLSSDGIASALPYLILVLVVGVTGWLQHQMIRRRQTGAPINPTQEMVMKIIPFFLPVFAFTLPAAIVFYFLVSNLFRIAQQYYITRQFYSGEDSLGAQVRRSREERGDGGSGKSGKKGPQDGDGGGSKNGGGSNGSKGGGGNKKPKNGGNKNGGNKNGGGKNSSNSKTAVKAKAKSGAPGRNVSGRSASARTQVQPKARKKKKR